MRMAVVVYFFLSPMMAGVFNELVTTDDGSMVCFSSTLRLRGTNSEPTSKIFCIRGDTAPVMIAQHPEPIKGLGLSTPRVSGDGQIISYEEARWPFSFIIGGIIPRLPATHLISGRTEQVFDGILTLAPSGRLALLTSTGQSLVDRQSYIVDLATMALTPVPFSGSINSSGTVAGFDGTDILLRTGSSIRRFRPLAKPDRIFLDETGTRIAYVAGLYPTQSAPFPTPFLRAINVATGEDRLLQAWLIGDPAFTRDGRIVVAGPSSDSSSRYQAILFDRDGLFQQLTDVPSGVEAVTVSGDGKILYVLTGQNELLRINLDSGEQQVVIPRTPMFGTLDYGKRLTPGSLVYLRGTRYTDSAAIAQAPLPDTLGGLELSIGDRKGAVLMATPEQVQFQVPFEQKQGTQSVRLTSGQSPFESFDTVEVSDPQPQFLQCDEFGTVVQPSSVRLACATHQDDFQQITNSRPARVGELIHIHLLGLGNVTPSVPTGVPGPLSPASVLTPMGCRSLTQDFDMIPVPILSATLASGLFGIYQLDIRVPGNVNRNGYMGLDCTMKSTFDFTLIFIPVSGN